LGCDHNCFKIFVQLIEITNMALVLVLSPPNVYRERLNI
jgi:hypothetical protein